MNTYEIIYRDDNQDPTFRNGSFGRNQVVTINAERYELHTPESGSYVDFYVGEEVVASVYSTPDMIIRRAQLQE